MAGELNAVRSSTLQLVERFFKCVALLVLLSNADGMSCCVVLSGCSGVPCRCTSVGGVMCLLGATIGCCHWWIGPVFACYRHPYTKDAGE
jgi:hypothetical protein